MKSRSRLHRINLGVAPLDALARWPDDQPLMMLHSGRLHEQWARWSVLASPRAVWRLFDDGRVEWSGAPPASARTASTTGDPLRDLDAILRTTCFADSPSNIERGAFTDNAADALPFMGGWIVVLAYELGRRIEPRAAQPSTTAKPPNGSPLIELAWCPDALVFDHLNDQWFGVGQHLKLMEPIAHSSSAARENHYTLGPLTSSSSRDEYCAQVEKTIEYIRVGDIYPANIAHRFNARFHGSSRALAAAGLQRSQPWYGAYLEWPGGRTHRAILSLSPELFLHADPATQRVVTRPIKGTRPEGATARELMASAKDAAELHMIVDLMRNDLGRVCEFGSVHVAESRTVESHPTVHHGVGEIHGTLRENTSMGELLRAVFPGGSVTGAPKIRAMQIIDELELGNRGLYCGSIGMISDCGAITLNIAIRTATIQGSPQIRGGGVHRFDHANVEYWAGAGIVADSIPLSEYQETIDKTAAFTAMVNDHSRAPVDVEFRTVKTRAGRFASSGAQPVVRERPR